MWNPAAMLPQAPLPITDALLVVTAALACGMAVTNQLARRLGAAASVLAVLALAFARTWLSLAVAVLVLLLWLLGRGVPSRRPRPAWMLALAAITAGAAVAAVVQAVD